MNQSTKAYQKSIILIFTAYTTIIVGINLIDNNVALDQWLRITMSLLPIIPQILFIRSVLNFFRSQDEVWQRIMSESIIISAGVVGLGTFTYGFLQGAMVLPDISLIWVWPALIATQGLAMFFVKARY